MIPKSVLYIGGRVSCTLGIIWAAAGALKELFGTHVTAPFIPNLDLTRVHEGKALFIGCCLYVAGSWLLRLADRSPTPPAIDDDPGVTAAQLAAGFRLDEPPVRARPGEQPDWSRRRS